MKEQLQKQDMVAGKEYRGYGWRNEYNEFFFRPAAVGSRAGRIKKVYEENDFGVCTSKDYVLIRMKLPKVKGGCTAYISAFSKLVDKVIKVFMKYEI